MTRRMSESKVNTILAIAGERSQPGNVSGEIRYPVRSWERLVSDCHGFQVSSRWKPLKRLRCCSPSFSYSQNYFFRVSVRPTVSPNQGYSLGSLWTTFALTEERAVALGERAPLALQEHHRRALVEPFRKIRCTTKFNKKRKAKAFTKEKTKN